MEANAQTEPVRAESRLRTADFVMTGHHCHSCMELFYVENGACRFLVEDHIYDLQPGDFLLVPSLVLHYTRYVFGACRRTVLLFGRDSLSEDVLKWMPRGERFFSEPEVFQVPEAYRDAVGAILRQIIREGKVADERSEAMRRILLQQLLLSCSRVCLFPEEPPVDIHTTDPHVVQAAHYISEHYMQPISSAEVAAAVGFSPNHLSRKFRRSTGIGLHEYLVFIRLHHAAQELVTTRDSITTVALRCGFSDSNYFKDCFKKKFGITPRQYKKG